jgi:hypothetical protein
LPPTPMFTLSIFIGIYSYIIFFLGLTGHPTRLNVQIISLVWLFILFLKIKNYLKIKNLKLKIKQKLLLSILVSQLLVNLIGVLGPELGFDALWYHLSLPKLWLSEHLIRFIPGAVYKYSVMPKLTETLYAGALAFPFPVLTKLIHFLFGLLILIPLYQLSRKFLSKNYSLLVLVIFYTNLIVGWESTTAYVDLSRTFFEILALKLFMDNKIYRSAVILGLAVCTKLIALGSLPIFICLLLFQKKSLPFALCYMLIAILIPAPWLIHAYISTGNPIYPFLSAVYPAENISLNLKDLWDLFTQSPDPISPIYIISAPLLFIKPINKWGRGVGELFLFTALALLIWFITPRTGGGRFILPYLPALSITVIIIINFIKFIWLKKFLIALALLLSCSSILYRFAANAKYLPVILHPATKNAWLRKHLNYDFGDYLPDYRTVSLIKIDPVLVYGINNMFYLPDNYKQADTVSHANFSWVLIRYSDIKIPPRYLGWQIIYTDPITRTYLLHP